MNRFVLLAFVVGAGLWLALSALTGRREAWDDALYFALGLPALAAISGALAWREPRAVWRWPLALALGQIAMSLVLHRNDLSLWPLSLFMFGVLALPSLAVAGVTASLRRRSLRNA